MKEIKMQELILNPLTLFSTDWMVLAAGNKQDRYNAMTISWGHLGSLWERDSHTNRLPTAVCYVRPSRYTKELLDQEETFTLSHFPEQYRKALGYLGSHSGRKENKIQATGLTPVFTNGTITFAEADLAFICRKLYAQELTESRFAERELVDFNYPQRDFHTMYVGEIIKILKAEDAK